MRESLTKAVESDAVLGEFVRKGIEAGCFACRKPVSAHFDHRGQWLGCTAAHVPVDTPFFLTPEDLDHWKQNLFAKVHSIFEYDRRGEWPENEGQCVRKFGTCDFYDVCSCAPHARRTAIESSLYEDNTWSPLNPPKNGKD